MNCKNILIMIFVLAMLCGWVGYMILIKIISKVNSIYDCRC